MTVTKTTVTETAEPKTVNGLQPESTNTSTDKADDLNKAKERKEAERSNDAQPANAPRPSFTNFTTN